MTPEAILNQALSRAAESGQNPLIGDALCVSWAEIIARNQQNRAGVRLVLSCALAKAHRPDVDIRKPYTEIGGSDSFSGRTYDEKYLGPFLRQNNLPVNDTTAFLTPALRNRNTVLTTETNLVGKPPAVYQAALHLINRVFQGVVTAEDLLAEILRCLVVFGNEKRQRLALLLQAVAQGAEAGNVPLSSEEIINLVESHLKLPGASRLPVLVIAAAYEAGGAGLGEQARVLESHNAADKQTGAIGDLEVTLTGDDQTITGYEMKTRRVTKDDIDLAVQKAVTRGGLQNYVFITTETIDRDVYEYAVQMYEKTNGLEVIVLDCMDFLRYFLHLFHRRRSDFLDAYQRLVLAQSDSSVGSPLKEAWLALRQAAENRL